MFEDKMLGDNLFIDKNVKRWKIKKIKLLEDKNVGK